MVFATDEQSVQDGEPIELYTFTGSYNTYRLTSHPIDITNSDGTYSADTISRSDAEEGTQEDQEIQMTIRIRSSHPIVQEYVINQPPPSMLLTISRVQASDLDDAFVLLNGQVISWAIKGREASLRVPSLFSYLLNGPLPPPKFQAPCNHFLGDERCQVDLSSPENTYDTTVTAIDGTSVTVAANAFADGQFNAGQMIFSAGGERRMVTSNTGLVFEVATPFTSNVIVTSPVTLVRGCNHSRLGDCLTKFDNTINFGGFPLVPNKNPFTGRI